MMGLVWDRAYFHRTDLNQTIAELAAFKDEKISIDETLNRLKSMPFEDIEFAKIDHHRGIRNYKRGV